MNRSSVSRLLEYPNRLEKRRKILTENPNASQTLEQRETLSDLAIFAGLVYDAQTILDIISEEIVQESSIIQYFTEKGIEQGKNSMLLRRYL